MNNSLRILNHCFEFSGRQGKDENVKAAQKIFLGRAITNGQATLGKYKGWK